MSILHTLIGIVQCIVDVLFVIVGGIQDARADIEGLVTLAVAVEQNVADAVNMDELKMLATGKGTENIICVTDFIQLVNSFLDVSKMICNQGKY